MNIISNSCVGAFLTRDYFKEKFNNPFVWSFIDTKSFFNLIKNYDKINWLNYELIKDKNWNFSIIIDNQIKVDYPHYQFKPNVKNIDFNTPLQRNVYSNKIWEYIVEKYEIRVKRMIEKNEKPIFILSTVYDFNDQHNYDKDYIKKIDDLDTNYDVLMVSNNFSFSKKKCYTFEYSKTNIDLAKEIYEMNIIKNP